MRVEVGIARDLISKVNPKMTLAPRLRCEVFGKFLLRESITIDSTLSTIYYHCRLVEFRT